jgi:beta-lactamase class A
MKRMPAYGPQPHTKSFHERSPQIANNVSPCNPLQRVKSTRNHQGLVAGRLVLLFCGMALLIGGITYGYSQMLPAWPQPAGDWQLSNAMASMSGLPSATVLLQSNTLSQASALSTTLPALPLGQPNDKLTQSIKALLAKQDASLTAHVFILNIDDGQWVSINGDTPVASASVIKLPLLLAYLQHLDAGHLQSNDQWLYEPIHQASGSGDLQYKHPGGLYDSVDIVTRMIQSSDNTATNMVLDNLGGTSAINRQLEAWGLRQTIVRNWLPDLKGTNTISPQEMAQILYTLLETNTLSEATRAQALDILTHVHNGRLIPQGLTPEVRKQLVIAHKTGDIGSSLGDMAWIKLPSGQRYLLCVQVERPRNDGNAKPLIQQLSALVYTAMTNQATTPQAVTALPTAP